MALAGGVRQLRHRPRRLGFGAPRAATRCVTSARMGGFLRHHRLVSGRADWAAIRRYDPHRGTSKTSRSIADFSLRYTDRRSLWRGVAPRRHTERAVDISFSRRITGGRVRSGRSHLHDRDPLARQEAKRLSAGTGGLGVALHPASDCIRSASGGLIRDASRPQRPAVRHWSCRCSSSPTATARCSTS